jgi:hypothetical protein
MPSLVSGAVARYAEEWWRSTDEAVSNGRVLKPAELVSAFEAARAAWVAVSAAGKGTVADGPLAAVMVQMHWAGWDWVNANTVLTRGGERLCFVEASPKMVQAVFEADARALTLDRATVKIYDAEQVHAKERQPIWWEVLQSCMRSKRCSALGRFILTQVVCGTYVCGARFVEWQYDTDGECQADGVLDTVWHRVTECSRTVRSDEGWDGCGRGSGCAQVEEGPLQRVRLVPARPDLLLRPLRSMVKASVGGVEVDPAEIGFLEGVPVAGDGSADHPGFAGLRRAGWAVVQRIPGTREVRALYGTVSCGPQTAPAAEHEAMAHACIWLPRCVFITDCALVANSWMQGWERAAAPSRFMAGYWRSAGRRTWCSEVRKTKAHVQLQHEPDCEEDWATWLNGMADHFAGKGRELHAYSVEEAARFKKQFGAARDWVLAAIAVLASAPSPRDWGDFPARAPRTQGAAQRDLPEHIDGPRHEFLRVGDSAWRCGQCLRLKREWASPLNGLPCSSVVASIERMGTCAASHTLSAVAVERGGALVFCAACGSWMESLPRDLAKPCAAGRVGRCRNAGKEAVLRRLAKGLHPVRPVAVSAAWQLPAGGG